MSRVFLSHSSRDSLQAVALKRWLVEQEPGLAEEIFLDLDPRTGIAPGERWKEALRRANERCEAVICLVSSRWEASRECLAEFRTAENLGKLILCAMLEPVESITGEWQRCNLFGAGAVTEISVELDGQSSTVTFSLEGLQRLHRGLRKAGIGAEFFPWPPPHDSDRAPYRGWEPLQEADAAVFFGRDGQIVRGLDALRGMRSSGIESLFVILGPSGTGKSSFLRAGLLPRLRREDLHFLPLDIVRPERSVLTGEQGFARAVYGLRTSLGLRHPALGEIKNACARGNLDRLWEWLLEARAAAAERLEVPEETPAPTLILPLDQAEELFSADAGPEAARFLELLAGLLQHDDGAGPAMVVAATIRADYYEALQTTPQLAGLKSVVFDELKPMPVAQFKEVILGPAARATEAGMPLTLEPALVDRLLADCLSGADTLPLLALALARLYEDYGDDGALTLAGYEAMGGLNRVVANEIDTLLAPDAAQRQQELAVLRSAFIPWLATINPDNDQPVRRVARLSDLPADARPLIGAMVDKRLLVRDERGGETVIEVALESLLRQWDELAGWLALEREDLKEADNLERAGAAWEHSGHNDAWLLQGARLAGAEILAARPGFRDRLDPVREFLQDSRAREEDRAAIDKRRQEAELQAAREKQQAAEAHAAVLRKRSRVLRLVLAAALVIAVVAVVGFVRASMAEGRATANAKEAVERNREAAALKLAAEGQSMLAGARPGGEILGMQLLLAAQSLTPSEEGSRVVASAVVAQRSVDKVVPVGYPVHSAAFSPDGSRMVSGSNDRTVRLWDAKTGEPVMAPLKGHRDSVISVAFSRDGGRIVSGSADKTVRLWNAKTGKPVGRPLTGHDGAVNSVAFSPDGGRIASGSSDGTIRLWDAATGQLAQEPIAGPQDGVRSVAFSPDGTRIVSGGVDKMVSVWDVSSGLPLLNLSGHEAPVNSVAYSPDGSWIASAGDDRTVFLWDANTGQPSDPMTGHSNWVWSVAFSPNGRQIVSGMGNGTVRVWHADGAPMNHQSWVFSIGISPDGKRVVSGGGDGSLRLWDVGTGKEEWEIAGHGGPVYGVAFSPDGKLIVSGSADRTVSLWDAKTGGQVVGPLSGHQDAVNSVAFRRDGRLIASAGADGAVRLWNVETGQPQGNPLTGHKGAVMDAVFSPNGKRIASAGADGTVRLWDAKAGRQQGSPMAGHKVAVNSVAFSRDGKHIVSGGADRTVRLWNAQTHRPEREPLRGHEAAVNSVAFSSDGGRIASGSDDRMVRLWDAKTGKPMGDPMAGHWDSVKGVVFSPDGQQVISGSRDDSVRTWPDPKDWRDALCAKLTQNMSRQQWREWISPDIDYIEVCPGLPIPADNT